MNRTRLVLAGRFLLAIALAGCSTAADRGGTGIPATPSPSATETTVAPSPSQEIRIWGGFAVSISYGSFAEWSQDLARHGDGVALVRVVNVSDFSWSTSSGGPPGPADVARYNRAEVDFGIGRLVTVELVRMLRGTWPASSTAFYWLPGGQIENDLTPPLDLNTLLIEPRPGLLAVASTWPGPISTAPTGSCGSTCSNSSPPTHPGASGRSTPTRRSA